SPETDRVAATWTGSGPIIKSHSKFSFHQKCIHFQATDKGKMRAASASGTLNGSDLGTTTDTFFARDSTVQVDHFCYTSRDGAAAGDGRLSRRRSSSGWTAAR